MIRDRRPDEVLIAMPSASGEVRGRVVEAARAGGLSVKTLPGLAELVSGDSGLATQLRPVEVEDVLGREPVEVDLEAIAGYVSGEVVMVTGAGGSIGWSFLASSHDSARYDSSSSTVRSPRCSRSTASSPASGGSATGLRWSPT